MNQRISSKLRALKTARDRIRTCKPCGTSTSSQLVIAENTGKSGYSGQIAPLMHHDLAEVCEAWPTLSPAIRAAILSIVRSQITPQPREARRGELGGSGGGGTAVPGSRRRLGGRSAAFSNSGRRPDVTRLRQHVATLESKPPRSRATVQGSRDRGRKD